MKPEDLATSPFGALSITDRRPPGTGEMDEAALVKRVLDELQELHAIKVTVLRIAIVPEEEMDEVRYDIQFPSDPPMFKCRHDLEMAHYYVGQQMGKAMLQFYVMKKPPKYSDIGG